MTNVHAESPAMAALRGFVVACGGNPPDWLRQAHAAAEVALLEGEPPVAVEVVEALRVARHELAIYASVCGSPGAQADMLAAVRRADAALSRLE